MIYQAMTFKDAYERYILLPENAGILSRLPLLTTSIDGESYVILAVKNLVVVGIYAFEDYDQENIQTLYIQVDKKYQNKGIATELIQELFNWARINEKSIISSPFSKQGERYIKDKLKNLAKQYDINYYISLEEFEWFN